VWVRIPPALHATGAGLSIRGRVRLKDGAVKLSHYCVGGSLFSCHNKDWGICQAQCQDSATPSGERSTETMGRQFPVALMTVARQQTPMGLSAQ
jgi:hypothetical protein